MTAVTRDGIPTEIRRAWAAAALACMGVGRLRVDFGA